MKRDERSKEESAGLRSDTWHQKSLTRWSWEQALEMTYLNNIPSASSDAKNASQS